MVSFASCGVSLNQRYFYASTKEDWLRIKSCGVTVAALSPRQNQSQDLFEYSPGNKVLYVLGGENAGVSDLVMDVADVRLSIPMAPQAESLSVASAASVIAYYHRWKTRERYLKNDTIHI